MTFAHPRIPVRLFTLVCAGLLLAAGCDSSSAPPREADAPSVDSPQTSPDAEPTGGKWYVVMLQDARIGYHHETVTEIERDGRPLRKIRAVDYFKIERFGQTTEQRVQTTSIERPDGEVRALEYQMGIGDSARRVRAEVRDGELVFLGSRPGDVKRLPWPKDAGGYFAVEQSLRETPMRPGERRVVKAAVPLLDYVAEIELTARDYEPTTLPAGEVRLLKIDQSMRLPDGGAMESRMWTDERGEVLKIEQAPMTFLRATREIALAPADGGKLDLGLDVLVRLDEPLERPRSLKRAVYKITLDDGDPAELIADGPAQTVEPTGEHTIRLTVLAVRPGAKGAGQSEPTAEDRTASRLVESDDETIKQLAEKAVANADGAWEKAASLEKFVHAHIDQEDYSQAFASAAEVAASRRGDCTEHAVLLAALCRAENIPCRAAFGLVYAPSEQGFAYHMWNEAWIDGAWIPLDATLGRGGVGADHIKFADSSLAGPSAYTSMLPVLSALGRLKIEVIEGD